MSAPVGTLMGVAHALRDHGYATIIARAVPTATFTGEGDPEVVGGIPGIVEGMGASSSTLTPDVDSTMYSARPGAGGNSYSAASSVVAALGIGPSSGLNIAWQRVGLAARLGPGHHVGTVLPDRMERYFSTALFDDVTAEL